MIRAFGHLRRLGSAVGFALALTTAFAADQKLQATSKTLPEEARTLVRLLEDAHYNKAAVKNTDFPQVITDYMSELDGQRLFFLGTDKARFMEEFGGKVYYNVSLLGNIEAAGAYEIFAVYQQRVQARITWVFDELKKDFDLTTNETYRLDRSKSEWPTNVAAADTLWRQRLKFELVAELLNNKKLNDDAKTVVQKPIDEAKTAVRKRYERMLKNSAEIEGNELAEIFLSTIARLYDPHSTYFSPTTFEDFGIQMRLKLVGIGALLGIEDDICVVKEIIVGGPADLGKQLKPGDKIISVGQPKAEPVEIIGMKLRKIVDMIRGQKGTEVHLMVQPANATDPSVRKEIVITRDLVKLNAQRARAAVFQVPDAAGKNQSLGVITLPAFYNSDDGDTDSEKSSASGDVALLIEQLKKENVQGLVLDLRHNGGGYLAEAIELAGLFIQNGPVVQVKSYNGEIQVDRDPNPRIAYTGPLAVLVDRFSASASEIVAGALQNYGRAIVIGDTSTHGKGTVQMVVEMKQQSPGLARSAEKTGAAKLTIQKYYLPSGASTQLKGVVPDITLPSINEFLPIGEGDLVRPMQWDQIASSSFDGTPLDPKVVTPLKQSSLQRQSSLEEFAFLRKNVDWFKVRQEQKLISVNLGERQKQKEVDDAFRKEMKAEKERIAKSDFAFKPFYLGPPPAPRLKAPKKDGDGTEDDDIEEDNDTYVKADVHLRETLRVVSDAIALGQSRDSKSTFTRAPLTASTRGG